MGGIIVDGTTRVFAVSGENAISNRAAPTLTELATGFKITHLLTPDGLAGFEASTDDVDDGDLESRHDNTRAGRWSVKGAMLRFKKQLTGDTAYTTLRLGLLGFIVVRRYLDATTAFASAHEVEVYPVEVGQMKKIGPERNTMTRFEAPVYMRLQPELFAVIA